MNSEFEPMPGSLPPEGPANKKIEEIIYPERSEEVDGDKWAPNQQPPIDTSLPDKNNEKLDEDDIAEMGAVAAADIVAGDLDMKKPQDTETPYRIISGTAINKPQETPYRIISGTAINKPQETPYRIISGTAINKPQETEMPDGIISESQKNIPNGTDTIGKFGDLEKRAFEESIEQKKMGERGWVGTSYVDPNALRPKPQVAAAPPPPSSPPSGPPSGPPPYDKNKMPDGVYDKASLKPTNEFTEEGVDNLIPAESYDTKPNQTETIAAVIDAESSKYKNNFPPEPEKP